MDEEDIARKMLSEEVRKELFGLLELVGKPLLKGQHRLIQEEIAKNLRYNVRTIAHQFTLKLISRAKGEPDPEPEKWDPKTHNVANLVIFGILESQIEGKLNGIYRRLIATATKREGEKTDETKLAIANRLDKAVSDAFGLVFA